MIFQRSIIIINFIITMLWKIIAYENTTIVISGDHLSMDSNFFNKIDDDYPRQVYNCVINPAVADPNVREKKRVFSDFYFVPQYHDFPHQ